MRHIHAKRLLIGGAVAIAVGLLLGAMPWDFIAPAPVILLTFILLGGGVLSVAIGLGYFIMNPIKRSA